MATAVKQNLHSQLRSVVDMLATMAVREITDLVDDGFAMLHLEISRSQKENEALKFKIQMLELQMARGWVQGSGRVERTAECRCCGVQNGEKLRKTASCVHAEFTDVGTQSGRDNSPEARTKAECGEVEEARTESVLVKEESVEEERDLLLEMNSSEMGSVERRAGSREKRPIQEMQNKAANHTEELTEQHRTSRAVWEVSGLDSALKTEPETERAKSPQHTGYEQSAGRLHSSCPESLMCERTSRLRTLCTQGADETEAGAPSCSYATESSCESLSIHSGLQSLPPTGNTAACSLSLGSVAVKPEAVMMDSAAAEEEAEVLSTWNEAATSRNIASQLRCRQLLRDHVQRRRTTPRRVITLRVALLGSDEDGIYMPSRRSRVQTIVVPQLMPEVRFKELIRQTFPTLGNTDFDLCKVDRCRRIIPVHLDTVTPLMIKSSGEFNRSAIYFRSTVQ
ncbi:hypothetical protein GJAV_G00248820 [Gymnothorax javanicus]|nr:hypothetical protein GJAV_G00248820 [Gymnothorax javanicus]